MFFALGLPIASDFARAIAPALDADSAEAVTAALADRGAFEQGAADLLAAELTDPERRERARSLTADLLGRALTSYQGVVSDTDALKVLLAVDTPEDANPEQRVKRLAIEVLSGHRRRAVELGLEDLDDVR